VFHDRTLKRLLGDARPLAEVGVQGLKAMRFLAAPGDEGVAVPTLEEALAMMKGRCVPLVEVKEVEAVPGVLAALGRLGMREEVMVQSFLPQAVQALSDAGLASGLLVDHALPSGQVPTCEQVQQAAAEVRARFVGLAQTLPDEEWMRALKGRGLPVAVWTVNAPDDMRRVLSLSPRVLITDDTAAAQARLGGAGAL
jgi:glycerophosphoryl diester phosphodiesterase